MRGSYIKYEEIEVSDDELLKEVISRLKTKLPTKLSNCEDFLIENGEIKQGEWWTGHNRDYEVSSLDEEQTKLINNPTYNKIVMTIINLEQILG